MFYRLIKLFVISGLLCLACAAKADTHAQKTHAAELAVKQHLHADLFAEDTSLESVLNSQVPYKPVISHPASILPEPTGLLKDPDCTLARAIASRNDQIPRKVLLILFPFHVFW
ncbi:hypothetical protein AAFN85_08670 [Mucilaginibacter sp. CAU 1740]|uniref:hypothetical protein n=1 Tax=Mucilaginibacter sp. CAU 1740 TaxID=3140365 RepID=UPI00325A66CA